jgi:hypothetical protein
VRLTLVFMAKPYRETISAKERTMWEVDNLFSFLSKNTFY